MKGILLLILLCSSVCCLGQSPTISGQAQPTVGNEERYTVEWTDGSGNPIPDPSLAEFTWSAGNLGQVIYTSSKVCYVRWDAAGTGYVQYTYRLAGSGIYEFTSIQVFPVMPPPPTVFTVTGGGVKCDATDVTIGLSDSEINYEYQLFLNAGSGYSPVGTSLAGTGNPLSWSGQTALGTYKVTAKRTGCSPCASVDMSGTPTIWQLIAPTISPPGTHMMCEGSPITLTRTSPQAGVTYNWRLNAIDIGGATSSTYPIPQVAVGDFVYDVRASAGTCETFSEPVQVQGLQKPTATYTEDGPLQLCQGEDVTFTAADNGNFTYAWKNDITGLVLETEKTFTTSTAGDYVLQVSNSILPGCTTTSPVFTVSVTPIPGATVTPAGPTTVCTGTVTLNANTGTGFSYEWTRNGTTVPGAASSTYSAPLTGDYRVIVSNNGCSSQPSAPVTVKVADIRRDIVAAGPLSFCTGSSTTLIAYYDEGYTYQWRKDGVDIANATQTQLAATIAGNYTVSISRYGCNSISEPITISTSAAPVAVITPVGATTFCQGGSVALNASNGTGYSHQWFKDEDPLPGQTSATHVALVSGVYTVVTTLGGCSTMSAGVTVVVNPLPSVSIAASGPTSICVGDFITLQTFATADGYVYQWRNVSGNISGETRSSFTTNSAGTYKVVVTNGPCSIESNSVTVTTKALPSPVTNVTGGPNLPAGTKVLLNAIGPADAEIFVWNTPGGTNIIYDNVQQSAAQLAFFEVGEKRISVSARKDGCLSVPFEKVLTVTESVTSAPSEIPDELKARPDRPYAMQAQGDPIPLTLISTNQIRDVFPSCDAGQYYIGFELRYDLFADRNTSVNWEATVDIDFMNGSTVLWTKSLKVDMATQTFISSIFHNQPITCSQTYKYKIKTKVTNVGGVQAPEANIYLKPLRHKKEADVLAPQVSGLTYSYGADGRSNVNWTYAPNTATYVDVEWVYIDNHESFQGTAAAAFTFRQPVRVTLNASDIVYKHHLNYPDGRVWYRIRAVGVNRQYPSHRISGAWSYGPGTSLLITNHESQKNWQAQTAFAEQGKYKKIMTYYDGTLRQRQALTNLSSDDLTLVAETLYDFEGRKAVDVLPVPSAGVSLDYKIDFNQFKDDPLNQHMSERTSTVQQKYHYDNANVVNTVMSNTTGAARYYSDVNIINSPHKNYSPHAGGYVYSQTEYLNDATGRVLRQSGVGGMFAMDGGKIMRYFYAEASRTELVRLFGTNVGNASHYKKNVMVDANDQVSVSYVDQTGKVIATALAGDLRTEGTPPATLLEPLPSYANLPGTGVQIDLSSKNIISDGKISVVHKILNEAYGTYYSFNYDMSSMASTIQLFGCVSCVYEISIVITDPDGVPVQLPAIAGNESGNNVSYKRRNLTATCPSGQNSLLSVQINNLYLTEVGDYTIVKSLSVQEKTVGEIITAIESDPDIVGGKQLIANSYTVDTQACEICYTSEAACPGGKDAVDQAVIDIAYLDCENIRQNIIRKLTQAGTAPTDDAIEGDPEFCAYLLCIADQDSDVFDKNLARIPNWDIAVQQGLHLLPDEFNIKDPFFGENHSGDGEELDMHLRLSSITIAVVNGEKMTGSLANVTDPAHPSYQIYGKDESTGQIVGPYHILYFNLYRKRSQMGETAFQNALKEQRWTLFRNFYLEAKRKLKINDVPAYGSCAAAKDRIKGLDDFIVGLEDTEAVLTQKAIDWGHTFDQFGITASDSVSDAALDMRMASFQSECNAKFTTVHFDYIREQLRMYFNSDNNNFLRLILQDQVSAHQQLINIQGILASYGCSLDSVAVDNPFVCAASTPTNMYGPNLVTNPALTVTTGCPSPDLLQYVTTTGAVQNGCFTGWRAAWGTPLLKKEGPTSFELSGTNCSQDALLNVLQTALVPGKQYLLRFRYKIPHYSATGITYIELAASGLFDTGGGQQLLATEQGSAEAIDKQSSSMIMAVQSQTPCASLPSPQTSPQTLWSTASGTYQQTNDFIPYETTFTVNASKQHLFIYHRQYFQGEVSSILIKDVEILEVTPGQSFCYTYNQSNSTLQDWMYTPDWAAEIQRCNQRAQQEKDVLVGYAIGEYLDEQASAYLNEYKTKCLANANEMLTYNYTPKEYHYTLYYYDQAGNLVQTVPPAGVMPLTYPAANDLSPDNPSHQLITRYEYTSVNQLVSQTTPDAGNSKFFFNKKGELRFSRNAQQALDNKYSYTKYDEHGRIIETGEMQAGVSSEVLLTYIDDPRFPTTGVPELPTFALTDVTQTFYDRPNEDIAPQLIQQNLRGRVARVEVSDQAGPDKTVTYYSYDMHGNVRSLVQQIPGLDFKRTDYVYDVVSGNVNAVFYQHRKVDQFIQKYTYDSDNRLKTVLSSSDAYRFEQEADYTYYAHGPLARVELGEYGVQGQDYLYTLQGWVKGVNIPFAGDPGQDGSVVAEDVYAYTLGYYQGDYIPSGAGITLPDTRDQMWTRFNELNGTSGLYNSNISWMVTDLAKIGQQNNDRTKGMQAMLYRYDQLNRIQRTYSLMSYTSGSGFGSRTAAPAAYDEMFTYDPNGNLQSLKRYDASGVLTDDFAYQYYSFSNKLRQVQPLTPNLSITSGAVASNDVFYKDITMSGTAYVPNGSTVEIVASQNIYMNPDFRVDQGADFTARTMNDAEGVFVYDAIGNLITDHEQGVSITWTPYGKVREVRNEHDTLVVSFLYDGAGNRVYKKVVKPGSTTTTHYARDASGNVMAVYSNTEVSEFNIYGSARLGHYKGGVREGHQTLGKRVYELTNHLGNVLAVITDNVDMVGTDFNAIVARSTDYYAFGLEMQERAFTDESVYRYGFNGKEKDGDGEFGDTSYDYGFRIYNPRIARFLSVDPLMKEYPMLTPYQFASNSPLDGIDLDGLEYLKHDEAKVELISGTAFIKLENFSKVFQNYYRKENQNYGLFYKNPDGTAWGTGMLGTIIIPEGPERKDARLSNKTNDPTYSPLETKLAPGNRFTRRLYSRGKHKPPVLRTGPGSKGGGVLTIVINAINFSFEYYINTTIMEDISELGFQTKNRTILQGDMFNEKWVRIEAPLNKALKDVSEAAALNWIPEENNNVNDLSALVNIVLYGGNGNESEQIKAIGQRIINEISGTSQRSNTKSEEDETGQNR